MGLDCTSQFPSLAPGLDPGRAYGSGLGFRSWRWPGYASGTSLAQIVLLTLALALYQPWYGSGLQVSGMPCRQKLKVNFFGEFSIHCNKSNGAQDRYFTVGTLAEWCAP